MHYGSDPKHCQKKGMKEADFSGYSFCQELLVSLKKVRESEKLYNMGNYAQDKMSKARWC